MEEHFLIPEAIIPWYQRQKEIWKEVLDFPVYHWRNDAAVLTKMREKSYLALNIAQDNTWHPIKMSNSMTLDSISLDIRYFILIQWCKVFLLGLLNNYISLLKSFLSILTWFWVCMFICVWTCTPGDQGDVWVCTCRWRSEVSHSPSWFFFFFSFHFWQTLWTWSSHTQVDWTAHPRDSAITAVSPHPALRFQTHILRCCCWCLIWVLGEIKLRSSSTLPTEPCCSSCGWFCHHSAGVGPVSQLLCGGGSSCT